MNDTQLHEQFIEEPYTTEEKIEHLRQKKLKLLGELNEIELSIEHHKQKLKDEQNT
jgi:TATA-binding protein-associated factor Taf7